MNAHLAGYVRDLFCLFREAAADAQRERYNRPDEASYFEGRETAFKEALMLMQSQADAFMIPREDIGLAGFDPLNDDLDPAKITGKP
jgi:hypothetical protein